MRGTTSSGLGIRPVWMHPREEAIRPPCLANLFAVWRYWYEMGLRLASPPSLTRCLGSWGKWPDRALARVLPVLSEPGLALAASPGSAIPQPGAGGAHPRPSRSQAPVPAFSGHS